MTHDASLTTDAAQCVIWQPLYLARLPVPKSDDPHFRLRVPEEMKASIERAAKENGRSMNAEIVYRLGMSLDLGTEKTIDELLTEVQTKIGEIASLARMQNSWSWRLIEAAATGKLDPLELEIIKPHFPERQARYGDLFTELRDARRAGDKARVEEAQRKLDEMEEENRRAEAAGSLPPLLSGERK